MKNTQSKGTGPVHQSVAGELKFKIGSKSMAVGFTDQRISAHAGTATFWGWLHPSGFMRVFEKALPHRLPLSNNNLTPAEKAAAFLQGILCQARRLTDVAYLRRDPLMPELLGIRRSPASRACRGFSPVSAVREATCGVSGRCGIGASAGCRAAKRDTLWIWIPRGSCTRTATSREWPWVTPARGSSLACIPWLPCSPRCVWWPRSG